MIERKYIAEGKALGDMRKAAGLTQTQAAALIHSTMRTWQDQEYGKSRMPKASWILFKLKLKFPDIEQWI